MRPGAAARLKHPGIVAVYDAGRDADGSPFLVMEFIKGRPLSEVMKADLPDLVRTTEIVATAAEAMAYAHRQGFVHRDVKPANILVDGEDRPHIADFGLALHESQQRQRPGESSGTLFYMAPEQARGESQRLDGRTDIWALGVVLYELLLHRRPFEGSSLAQIQDEILHRDPKPPRQIIEAIPAELERICLKCLAKDPNQSLPDGSGSGQRPAPLGKTKASAARPALALGRCGRCRHAVSYSGLARCHEARPQYRRRSRQSFRARSTSASGRPTTRLART